MPFLTLELYTQIWQVISCLSIIFWEKNTKRFKITQVLQSKSLKLSLEKSVIFYTEKGEKAFLPVNPNFY